MAQVAVWAGNLHRRDHALNSFELSIIDNIQKAYDAESLY